MSLLRIVPVLACLAAEANAQVQVVAPPPPPPSSIRGGLASGNVSGGAQEQPQPVIGKGIVSGTVVGAQTEAPIKKAHVTLNGAANLAAVTDAAGNFTFRALPPGLYIVNANQEDFFQNPLTVAVNQVTLKEDEEKQGVHIKLDPAAGISGKVLDEDGDPIARCSVSASRSQTQMGRRMMNFSSQAVADEQGGYHIRGLAPGRYQISAHCQESFPAPHGFMKRNDPMIPQEGFAGASYSPTSKDEPPGTSGVRVRSGQELSGIDFHLKRSLLYTIQVTLAGAEGTRFPQVSLMSSDGSYLPFGPIRSRREGIYTFRHVPPGSYTVEAMVFDNQHSMEAHQEIEIGKTPVTEVSLALSAAAKLTGSIEFDDPAHQIQGIQITMMTLDTNVRGPMPQAQVGEDGRFELSALPGHYRLGGFQGAYIKHLSVGGQDVSPERFELGSASGQIHLAMGTKVGKIEADTGVKPAQGQALSAMLISENGEVDMNGQSFGQADQNGQIQLPSVAPGKYRLVVVPSQNPWTFMQYPDILKGLAASGTAVEMTEGGDVHITVAPVSPEDLQKTIESAE